MADTTDDLTPLLCRHCKRAIKPVGKGWFFVWEDETGGYDCPVGGYAHCPQYDDDDLMVVLDEIWKVVPYYLLAQDHGIAPDGKAPCVVLFMNEGDFPGSKIVKPTNEAVLALLRSVNGQYVFKYHGGFHTGLEGLPVYWHENLPTEHLPTRPKFNEL